MNIFEAVASAGGPNWKGRARLTVALSLAVWSVPSALAVDAGAVLVRLDLVENTREGLALTRCRLEAAARAGEAKRWRIAYGEVRPGGDGGWDAMRPRSACVAVPSERAPDPWTLRGSPYLILEPVLRPAPVPGGGVRLEAALTIEQLSGFDAGTAKYDRRTETRTLHVPADDDVLIPISIAGPREAEAFGVRELLLRVRAVRLGVRQPVAYGEIAVTADVPRANILLDGDLVGHTSARGPVVLSGLRTGQRVISVRDASGREARTLVQVEESRRADVSLALLPGPTGPVRAGLRPLGRNAQGGEEFWREADAALVIRVPGGEFRMGSAEDQGEPAERPRHPVRVAAFLMDKTEVTWGQYLRFVAETARTPPKVPVWGTPEAFPASYLSWDDARAYCEWAGGRLPTEAEWEWAARGDDGRTYPWGDGWDPSRCNTQEGGPHRPTAAGVHPECVARQGVLDLAGSMWEWCHDWFDPGYYAVSPADNPTGPAAGRTRASRGGCWITGSSWVRSANRQGIDPTWPDPTRGFRCVQDDPEVEPTPPSLAAVSADPGASRLAFEVRTAVSHRSGPVTSCDVVQVGRGRELVSWSVLGEATAAPDGGVEFTGTTPRCGSGPVAGRAPDQAPSRLGDGVPWLTVEVSVTPGWDPAPMDPGPVPVVHTVLAFTWRRLTGFSPDRTPLYGDPVRSSRTVRLGEGEEFAWPVPVANAPDAASLDAPDVLLRVRAGRSIVPGGTTHGHVVVTGAAPGSKVLVDGGVAGRAGADGSLALPTVAVGEHQVGIESADGIVVRLVTVVRGRTVMVSPETAGPAGPTTGAFAPMGRNPQGFEEYRRARDSAVMVRIPEGEYVMGNLETEGQPRPHTVYVSEFLMDTVPVTWGLFKRFAAATGRPLPPAPYWGVHDDHPVTFVRWDEGQAYCEWAGGRLPSEAEREKAARGTDGRKFPWGNEEPTPARGVFRRNWGWEGTDRVGIRPDGASPYGLLDTGGNVWEWCQDWYERDYYATSPRVDPTGPSSGRARVVRGGSWDSRPSVLSASARNWGYVGYREGDFGFRCAADPLPRLHGFDEGVAVAHGEHVRAAEGVGAQGVH